MNNFVGTKHHELSVVPRGLTALARTRPACNLRAVFWGLHQSSNTKPGDRAREQQGRNLSFAARFLCREIAIAMLRVAGKHTRQAGTADALFARERYLNSLRRKGSNNCFMCTDLDHPPGTRQLHFETLAARIGAAADPAPQRFRGGAARAPPHLHQCRQTPHSAGHRPVHQAQRGRRVACRARTCSICS